MALNVSATAAPVDDRVVCLDCGFRSHSLLDHLVEVHNTTPAAYLEAHEGSATVSERALAAFEARTTSRKAAPSEDELTSDMMGVKAKVDVGVDPEDCLPLPEGYRFPTKGKALRVFKRALMALVRGRNLYLWGMPGTGKDALGHAYSAMTRRPTVMVTFRPGTDLSPWFYSRSIGVEGTGWEFGHLWRALVEGVEGRDGKRRAPLMLLSDVDRADQAQAEWFRILTDSISGRILGPDGKMHTLYKDEWGNSPQFMCTANSCGSGDSRGRMASASPVDASIMDRLGRKVEAVFMHWDDESAILREKFPEVSERAPSLFTELGNATEALRKAIETEEIYAEFTHRGLCEVLAEAEDLLHFYSRDGAPKGLLRKAFLAWLDGLDSDNRLEAKRLIDAHIDGGALGDD